MEKLITYVVPCFNSGAYMHTCIDSLLVVGEVAQIIIVNDGSTDNTLEIAQTYAERYPDIIDIVDQPNSGWGEGVNQGLARAKGTFFKIVDSDDRLELQAAKTVIATLERLEAEDAQIDLFVTNFVYDHVSDNTTRSIDYRKMFPSDEVFSWEKVGSFAIDQYLMVHALIYRTQILRDSGIKLPKKLFYMDSFVVLHPLPLVKKLYYLDIDHYYYLIGRAGQSIEIAVLKKRIDQQLTATHMAIHDCDFEELSRVEPNLALCMARYVAAMMSVSTIYLFFIGTPEALAKNRDLWAELKATDSYLYKVVRKSPAGLANRKTALGRLLAKTVYLTVNKIFKYA